MNRRSWIADFRLQIADWKSRYFQDVAQFNLQSSMCNCLLSQGMIAKDDCGHRLHDRDGPRQDAWIVATFGGESRFFVQRGHGLLLTGDRRSRFERDAEEDLFAIANSAL